MKTIEINVGNIVQLKAGGPKMTVDKIDNDFCDHVIHCIWFDKNDELKYANFSYETLKVLA